MKTESNIKKAEKAQPAPTAVDYLLESLVFLTAHHGRAKSAEAIRAGLAYDEKGMGPQLFCEAAQRMALKAKIVKRDDPWNIDPAVLPSVLILKDNKACVLESINRSGGTACVFLPENGEIQQLSRDEM